MLKSKTFWTALTGIVGSAAAYYTGAMDAPTAVQTAFTGLLAIFLRHGIATSSQ